MLNKIHLTPPAVTTDGGTVKQLSEGEKQKLNKQVEKLKLQYPIFFWVPYEQQEDFIRSDNKLRMFVGANRIGKTETGIIEDISWCLGYRPYLLPHDPAFKTPIKPPVHGLITTESLGAEGTAKKVVENKLKEYIPKSELKSTKKNQQGVTVFYEFKIGSTLSIMAYEQDMEKFEGFRIHFWHGDEPPKEKIYGAIARGLVDYGGYSWVTMTPVASEGFTIKLFENPENFRIGPIPIESNLKHQRKWYGKEVEVGGLTKESIDLFRKQLLSVALDPSEIEARLSGHFKYLSGKILPFNSEIHLVDPFTILKDEGSMYVAIDPHDHKPWAVSFVVAHRNGNIYTVDELAIKGTIAEINFAIQDILSKYQMKPKAALIDPQAIVEESDMESLLQKLFKESRTARYPLPLQKASRGEAPKQQGIQTLRGLMNFDVEKGKYPKWFFFKTCIHTIRQINGWVYDSKTGKALKDEDDFPENHYRIANVNPHFSPFKVAKSKHTKKIIGIGS